MKKLFITLSAIAVTMLAFTATSDAGHNVRYLAGYDHCGRPVYAYRYVQTYSYSHGSSYCQPSYRSYGSSHSRSHGSHSSYRSYSQGHSSRPYSHSYSQSGRSYCR